MATIKLMRKLSFFLTSLFVYLTTTLPVSASTLCPSGGEDNFWGNLCGANYTPDGSTGQVPFIGKVITIILVVASILALFFLLLGGIRWITSGGDKAKLDQARSTLTAAIIGLVLTFLSFLILNIIFYLFLGRSNLDFVIPSFAR